MILGTDWDVRIKMLFFLLEEIPEKDLGDLDWDA